MYLNFTIKSGKPNRFDNAILIEYGRLIGNRREIRELTTQTLKGAQTRASMNIDKR